MGAKAHDKSTPLYALARLSTRRENLDECMKILVTAGRIPHYKDPSCVKHLHSQCAYPFRYCLIPVVLIYSEQVLFNTSPQPDRGS